MKALRWDGESLGLREVPHPRREPEQAMVQVNRAGICNTDLEILRGYHGFTGTLGHEFVGTVAAADDPLLVGRRVVCDINCACGRCATCRDGNPHHCPHRSVIGIKNKDGAFAEYLTCPQSNLVLLPDNLEDDRAVFAEPVAAALEILEQVDCTGLQEAAVVGDGKLGLLIAMCLAHAGLHVSLIGHHEENHELVRDLNIAFFAQPPEKRFPLVVEATGNPSGFIDALERVAPRGTLVLKSTYAGKLEFNAAPVVVNEITVLGSRCGPMEKAVALLARGGISPERLIQARYPLKDGVRAIKKAAEKGTLKILLEP